MGKEKKFKLFDDFYFSLLCFKKSVFVICRIFFMVVCYFIWYFYFLKLMLKLKFKFFRDEEYLFVSVMNLNFYLNFLLYLVIYENF